MRRSSLTLESELECVPAGNPDRRSATRPRRLQCARFLCIWHHKSQLHAGSPRQLVADSTVSMPVAQAFGTRNGARPDSFEGFAKQEAVQPGFNESRSPSLSNHPNVAH